LEKNICFWTSKICFVHKHMFFGNRATRHSAIPLIQLFVLPPLTHACL